MGLFRGVFFILGGAIGAGFISGAELVRFFHTKYFLLSLFSASALFGLLVWRFLVLGKKYGGFAGTMQALFGRAEKWVRAALSLCSFVPCGDACGARCACPALFAPSLARGAASVCRRGRPRDEGHFLSQHAARTRAPVLCLRSERRGARASARGKGRGLRRDRLCRDERPPARARPNGCGRGDEIPALLGAPLRGRDGACGLRDPAPHLCGGNERLHRGDALPLCDAHLQALSVCRGARDPDFSRFLALSAVYARGCAFRRKNRREGRRALRGFPALADGICGDRAYSVSLGRVFGVDVFSGLYSLRSPFRAAPQGNTSPPRAGTECRWNSSRGRA